MPYFVSYQPVAAALGLANQVGQQQQQGINFNQGLQSAQFNAQLQQQAFARDQERAQLAMQQREMQARDQERQQIEQLRQQQANQQGAHYADQYDLGQQRMQNQVDVADLHERARTGRFLVGDANKWNRLEEDARLRGDQRTADFANQMKISAARFENQQTLQNSRQGFQHDENVQRQQNQMDIAKMRQDTSAKVQQAKQQADQAKMAAKTPEDAARIDAQAAKDQQRYAEEHLASILRVHSTIPKDLMGQVDPAKEQVWEESRDEAMEFARKARENAIAKQAAYADMVRNRSTAAAPQTPPQDQRASTVQGAQDFQSYYESIPSGQPYTAPDGTTRIKR